MEKQEQAILRCEDVSFYYGGEEDNPKVTVFEHLSLEVPRGEFVAILGHNGSGKSTLAKHFNAILLPEGGTVWAAGIDTKDEDRVFELRSHVGMVFQNPDNQIVATLVEEDVAFGLENMGVEPAEIRRRVDEALHQVDMYDYRDSAPHQLSGGQKQRVAIAGIIAMRPDCIVLDEPTAMLDPRGRREVMETLHMLVEEHGITVVLITHYMDEAAQCRRVIVMDNGELILDGSPEEVFSHVEKLQAVGLDVPQSSELAWELGREGIRLPEGIITEERCVAALSALLDKNS